MPPSLKILHPTGDPPYPPTEPVRVNSTEPVQIRTSGFDGEISVWVKDYHGLKKKGDGMEYFSEKGREGMTYGIVVRGERTWRIAERSSLLTTLKVVSSNRHQPTISCLETCLRSRSAIAYHGGHQ